MNPTPPWAPPPAKVAKPSRGVLLTVLLVLLTLAAFVTVGASWFALGALRRLGTADPDDAVRAAHLTKLLFVVIAVGLAQLASASGMWMWKRWGIYGFVGLSLLEVFVSAKVDPHHHVSYRGLVWVVLVLAAALPRWSAFED